MLKGGQERSSLTGERINKMKSVKDIDVFNKRVLVRVDYNLPMNETQIITDDNRIKATLPLIEYLLDNGACIILISHMGRPKGEHIPELSLAPAAIRLSKLLNKQVNFVDDCVGEQVEERAKKLNKGEILLLENLRFHGQ